MLKISTCTVYDCFCTVLLIFSFALVSDVPEESVFVGEVPKDELKMLVCKASHTDPTQPFEHIEPI